VYTTWWVIENEGSGNIVPPLTVSNEPEYVSGSPSGSLTSNVIVSGMLNPVLSESNGAVAIGGLLAGSVVVVPVPSWLVVPNGSLKSELPKPSSVEEELEPSGLPVS